ncbi:MAG: hypothetical protein SFU25_04755 [Candidatus Caenarcaniphilales bacterium]|nr:hypothetical protein [Candidatus Caenarcaniphilales bacterium]
MFLGISFGFAFTLCYGTPIKAKQHQAAKDILNNLNKCERQYNFTFKEIYSLQ